MSYATALTWLFNVGFITGLNWRLMLGSAAFPAFFVMAQVYFCPESPRWLIGKGRYGKAYEPLCRLRHTKLQAARDLYRINALLEEEASISTGRSAIVEMFAVARNRRAALASGIVMFMLPPGYDTFILALTFPRLLDAFTPCQYT
ncbi:hypothetical protein BCR35DRAFT_330549 [Leucosporidium creatinivorum]|uniref:Major facilitator superfamily (MFS) profile domain-containing protein n=1 Tax=Leucosporidium creatinivorum TaxID=106004 RepID=A0A1Y2FRP9_9BASI|nr:hypothetical protein BCR35DRAFT_330549 [Leucosporidium creatinivorum]